MPPGAFVLHTHVRILGLLFQARSHCGSSHPSDFEAGVPGGSQFALEKPHHVFLGSLLGWFVQPHAPFGLAELCWSLPCAKGAVLDFLSHFAAVLLVFLFLYFTGLSDGCEANTGPVATLKQMFLFCYSIITRYYVSLYTFYF